MVNSDIKPEGEDTGLNKLNIEVRRVSLRVDIKPASTRRNRHTYTGRNGKKENRQPNQEDDGT